MARQTLTLFIDLEGDSAQDPREAAALLSQAAQKAARLHDAEGWIPGESVALIDSNGNRVGEFMVEER